MNASAAECRGHGRRTPAPTPARPAQIRQSLPIFFHMLNRMEDANRRGMGERVTGATIPVTLPEPAKRSC